MARGNGLSGPTTPNGRDHGGLVDRIFGPMVRRHVVVEGRVQGVFFRDSCRREAERMGLTGWVRNRHDGAVEAEFEGSPEAVDRLTAWCRTGPSRAVVTRIDVTDVEPAGDTRFSVR